MTDQATTTVRPGQRSRPAGGHRLARPDQLSHRTFVAGVGAVLAVQLVVCGYLVRHSWFFAEDFTFFEIWRDTPVSGELLRTSVFGHLIPGFVLVQKFFGSWFGASWGAAALVTLAVQLGGTIAFARLLLAWEGRRTWWIVWLTAAFGLSVVGLNTAPWWAATTTMQITLATAVSAWGCALRFARSRRLRHLVSLALVYAVSVAFFEKSIATSVYLGLFVLLVGTADSDRWRERIHRALSLWPVWLVIAAITLLDLAVYLTGPYLDAAGQASGLGVQTEYLARSLPEGAFTTLIGAVYPQSTIPGPDLLTVVVATGAALGAVAWTSWHSRLARRAWIWYFVVILFSQALVARGRLGVIDVDTVVHNLRYQGDAVYLFLIALGVSAPAALRNRPVARPAALVIALVAPVLTFPLWLQSIHTISEQTPGRAAREYYTVLREGGPESAVAFLDLPAPPTIIPEPMYPWNMASDVYPVIRPGTEVTTDPDGASWIRPDGTMAPVQLADLTQPSEGRTCVRQADGPVPILDAPPGGVPAGQLLLLALSYTATQPVDVQLYVGDGATALNDVRGTGEGFSLDTEGQVATYVYSRDWQVASLGVAGPGRVCVESVRLATPQ